MRYGNVYYAYNIIDRKMYVIYCKYIACTMYNIVYCLVNVQDRFYYGYWGLIITKTCFMFILYFNFNS